MSGQPAEVIIVRSLVGSDLGLFAAHRATAKSKQRAIQINAPIARRLLSSRVVAAGRIAIPTTIVMGATQLQGPRPIYLSDKNWRFGGNVIKDDVFAALDSADFMLIRSAEENDGAQPITVHFISRALDQITHAGLVAVLGPRLKHSMAVVGSEDPGFQGLAMYCSVSNRERTAGKATLNGRLREGAETSETVARKRGPTIPPIPKMPAPEAAKTRRPHDKLRSPHLLEKMMQVAGDLSAPAQFRFMETVGSLADHLRTVLLETGGIIRVERNHTKLWGSVAGRPIGFIDGGLANLSMLGSAPVAARVGGYVVTPGETSPGRERFVVLKQMIDELYAQGEGGVYEEHFPDIGALRDAARISVEAAGGVKLVTEQPDLTWVMMHGALVNPVSRYTDVMRNSVVRHSFPHFSDTALELLLPAERAPREGRDRNFISVHLRQLQLLQGAAPIVCGVVERESTTSSVCRAVLNGLDDDAIAPLVPRSPEDWRAWFMDLIDPDDGHDAEGQRINDSLLFSLVLEPGEALRPVMVDRNDSRRAPRAWADEIAAYPKPWVSFLQVTDMSPPVRIEVFETSLSRFSETVSLIMHSCLLLPRYSFPAGLDIVDKFAKVPNWMARPVNTFTAVTALKTAMDSGDARLFDALRRMMCGSTREWLLRPGIGR